MASERDRVQRKVDGLKVGGVDVGKDEMEDDEGDSRRCAVWNELSVYRIVSRD